MSIPFKWSDYCLREAGEPLFNTPKVQQLIRQWQIDGQGESELLSACVPLIMFLIQRNQIIVPGYEEIDLVHEMIAALPAKLRRYQERGHPNAYLTVICRNFLLNLREKVLRHRSHIVEDNGITEQVDCLTPLNAIMIAEAASAPPLKPRKKPKR
jgi:hypothetical protein